VGDLSCLHHTGLVLAEIERCEPVAPTAMLFRTFEEAGRKLSLVERPPFGTRVAGFKSSRPDHHYRRFEKRVRRDRDSLQTGTRSPTTPLTGLTRRGVPPDRRMVAHDFRGARSIRSLNSPRAVPIWRGPRPRAPGRAASFCSSARPRPSAAGERILVTPDRLLARSDHPPPCTRRSRDRVIVDPPAHGRGGVFPFPEA